MKESFGQRDTNTESPALRLHKDRRGSSILAGAALGVTAIGCLAAVLMQHMPTNVDVTGVLWPEGGVTRLGSPREGNVERLMVTEGSLVEARQPIILVRHRPIPAEESAAMQKREEMLKARLEDVRSAIAGHGAALGSVESVALIRLEDELSASLVALNDRLSALRVESATVLYAPRAGRITEMRAHEGEVVHPEQSLATIVADGDVYQARAYVGAALAARLSIGMEARITIASPAGSGAPRIGRVRHISSLPVAPRDTDRSVVIREPMYEVEIAFDDELGGRPRPAPGAPIGVSFELDQTTLLDAMLGRFRGT